jgi:hypothetical protein
MSDGEEKEWYSSQEAADYLGIAMPRLALLRRTGRIKGVTYGGKNPRYTMYHIDQLRGVDPTDLRRKQPKQSDDEVA